MALTRRELIAAGGEVAAVLAVAGALPHHASAAGTKEEIAVVTATWKGVSRADFTAAYTALSDGGLSELAQAEGVLALWSEQLQEGTLISQWKDLASARSAADSPRVAQALTRAAATPPRSVSVVLVTSS